MSKRIREESQHKRDDEGKLCCFSAVHVTKLNSGLMGLIVTIKAQFPKNMCIESFESHNFQMNHCCLILLIWLTLNMRLFTQHILMYYPFTVSCKRVQTHFYAVYGSDPWMVFTFF